MEYFSSIIAIILALLLATGGEAWTETRGGCSGCSAPSSVAMSRIITSTYNDSGLRIVIRENEIVCNSYAYENVGILFVWPVQRNVPTGVRECCTGYTVPRRRVGTNGLQESVVFYNLWKSKLHRLFGCGNVSKRGICALQSYFFFNSARCFILIGLSHTLHGI